jgi:hypothetical protein
MAASAGWPRCPSATSGSSATSRARRSTRPTLARRRPSPTAAGRPGGGPAAVACASAGAGRALQRPWRLHGYDLRRLQPQSTACARGRRARGRASARRSSPAARCEKLAVAPSDASEGAAQLAQPAQPGASSVDLPDVGSHDAPPGGSRRPLVWREGGGAATSAEQICTHRCARVPKTLTTPSSSGSCASS